MAVLLSPVGGVAGQFFDNNGNPLVGGKLFTYAAGTTTPLATFTSALGVTPHSNPIILNAGGRVPGEIWLTDGLQYKFVLFSSSDQLIGSWDNIVGINSNFVNFVTSEEVQIATAGQTVFTLTTMQYQPGTNSLAVFVDGVNQVQGSTFSYVETSSTVVTFTTGLHEGALVKFVSAQTLTGSATSSDLVSYTPAGAGAVATTVQTKLRETVSVKDFGAVGDGVTDDTAAIQAAIDSAFTQQKILDLSDGTYLVSATLNVPRPFVLKGDGEILYTSTSTACLEITALTDAPVLIDGITLTGPFNSSPNYSVNSNGVRISGTSVNTTSGAVFQNMTVQGFGDQGFRISFCNKSVVQDCVIQRVGRVGVGWRSCKEAMTLRNKIYDIAPGAGGNAPFLNAYGIYYTQANADTQVCEDGYVFENHVENVISWTGIDTHGGQRIIIRDNTVLNTYLGIVIMGPGGGASATVSADFCVVQDNYVRRDPSVAPYSRAGIAIIPSTTNVSPIEAQQHIVTGNYVENNGGNSITEGAILLNNTRRIVCTNNQVINSLGRGIQLTNTVGFRVFGGVLKDNYINNVINNTVDNTLQFLYVRPNSDTLSFLIVISDNVFYRSAGDGIAVTIDPKPVGSPAAFGPLLEKNIFTGFDASNNSRLFFASGTLGNVSNLSQNFFAPDTTSEISSTGILLSEVRGISSVGKSTTGVYRVNLRATTFSFSSANEYNVIVTPIDDNPRVISVTKATAFVDVKTYDLTGTLVDCGFSIQISRNFIPTP